MLCCTFGIEYKHLALTLTWMKFLLFSESQTWVAKMADQLTGQHVASAESAAMSAIPTDSTMQATAELELGGAGSLIRRPFDPAAHELDSTFRLTKYADLKG